MKDLKTLQQEYRYGQIIYKHNNTSKYLIGITPGGAISFLSLEWDGRVSDKQITKESSFFNKVSMGDCILAD